MMPMMLVLMPRTLDRKRGKMLMTISLEMSMKKLVRLTAQMLRGSDLMDTFSSWDCGSVDMVSSSTSFLWSDSVRWDEWRDRE